MIRKYSLIVEGDDATGFSAYVPELPTILVTAPSLDELSTRASTAIRLYWDSLDLRRSPGSVLQEIEVDIPA